MTMVQLPVDHPRRGGAEGAAAAVCTVQLLGQDATAVRGLADRLGVSPDRVGQAAYAALLHRYTGETELDLGGGQPLSFAAKRTWAQIVAEVPDFAPGPELALTVTEAEDGGLGLTATYDGNLFEAATVLRMLGHYRALLTAPPDQPITTAPLLSAAEREQLLRWAGRTSDAPEASMKALFEEQVRQAPDRVAVVFGEASLTYAELNRRANGLAGMLRGLGVGPDQLVGICVERSLELAVGLVAIIKAGGAYVPLDPNYPPERLAYMLADAAMPVLLTQSHLVHRLPEHGARVICIDEATPGADADPAVDVRGRHLAYVTYTSGSTGRPKGVPVPQRGVVRLVRNADWASLTADDTFLQLTTVTFDTSVMEIWGALLNGARLVIMPPHQPTLEELGRALVQHQVSVLWLTSGLFHLMVEHQLEALLAVRQVVAGGDVLSASHVRRMVAALKPGHRLINGYGPTENSTFTTCFTMTRETVFEGSVPIGLPIAGTQVYILDKHRQLVPQGVPGELCTGGEGLAYGYLNRPELTAERYIETEFGLLYKTGDLARWLPDGTVEFLGRTDYQVKIRGFRIELGEIEYQLGQHPNVADGVVLAREDGGADRRLVAYAVAVGGAGRPSDRELRDFLADRLPAFMIPSVFVWLEALPLNPNGKVDRRALPAPAPGAGTADYVAPSTETEERLAVMWAALLRVERVGVRDDFFALGGHSLLATQVLSRVREQFGVELPLSAFFAAPTVAGLAAEMARAVAGGPAEAPIEQLPRDGAPLPLSFAQQRLWFFDQLTPGSPLYNVAEAIRLLGPLEPALLEESLNRLVARHEALRTNFTGGEGHDAVQVIRPAAPLKLAVADADAAGVERLVAAEATRPFDLARDLLLRAQLVRLGEQDHLLLLTIHHIVVDGWSLGVLYAELGQIYAALAAGREPALPPLPIQYADFAAWQREHLTGELLEQHLAYWRQELAGAPAVLELPTDKPRPATQSFRGARRSRPLAPALLAKLGALSRQEGATLFMTLLAAYQSLLHRYTGQTDLLTGVAIANRNRAETEGLIGFFVNTLPMRAQFARGLTFRQLLQQVRGRALGGFAHQDLPLDRLVEALQPGRDPARAPLIQTLFALQNAPMDDLQIDGVTTENLQPTGVDTGTAKYDLLLTVEECAGETRAVLEYCTDLYEDATAERLLGHFEMLLTAVADDADQAVDRLPLLTAAEEQRLLTEWAGERPAYPQQTIHALFAEQARLRPEAVAVAFGADTLTYAELDRRSDQLAARLRRLGVGPDLLVGLCLERSPLLIVALLGILKAGGAYLPLDPDYPAERLAFMVADAAAPVLLTQSSLVERLPETEATVILLDRGWSGGTAVSSLPDETTPDNLAYVCYTSGSTGRPKGVLVPHRAVVRLVRANHFADLTPDDVFLQLAPVPFDASTLEIWGALLNGARLVVMPPQQPSLEELGQALVQHKVSVLWLTAGLFHLMVEQQLPALTTVRQVLAGGDVLSVAHVRQMLAALKPGHKLINGYGPTENTTFTCCYPMTGETVIAGSVPIGRPIANTSCYILDANLQPVPQGVPGELYAGGDGLARGYLNRPELTAERFIETAFGRLYKTGDLVRWLPDGSIEFLGRSDDQVKIRGFRIELGEIEAALAGCPGVGAAVVVAREGGTGGKQLVAYLKPAAVGGAMPAVAELRAHLKERLPDYMLPAAFVKLDAFPLNPNGKVDRKALPAPDFAARPEREYVAPRNHLEETLAAIFGGVLGLEQVSVFDKFFEIGGHSLLATRVVSRVREQLQAELPLRALFEHSTVAELAVELSKVAPAHAAPPIRPADRAGALPLSFSQQRLWFIDQLAPGSAVYNVPEAYWLRGDVDVPALRESLHRLAARHEVLRTNFAAAGQAPVLVIHPQPDVPLAEVDLTHLPPTERKAEAERLAVLEAGRAFDLAAGPLLRATLIHLGDEQQLLMLNLHHMVVDGWSLGVLHAELSEIYNALRAGRAPELAALPIQYTDWAAWQQQHLTEVLERQQAWWLRELEGAPTVLALPTDKPRPAVQSYRGARVARRLPGALLAGLEELSHAEGATPFMTLLAAFQTLLHRYTGQQDLLVGSAIAGRTRAEIEGLIGFFVNTLPMRAQFTGGTTFRQLLRQVRQRALGAFAHQEQPLEKLVEVLQPERNLSHAPLVQVLFALQNADEGRLALDGVTVDEMVPGGIHTGTAKSDLVLTVEQAGDGAVALLEYCTDLFEAPTAERLLGHYATLLAALLAEPDRALAELPLLTPAEEQQILGPWAGAPTEYPQTSVQARFAEQARLHPDAVAVQYGDATLTYAELDRRSNQLASRLRRLGVGRDALVGICLERSPLLITAQLAILKAGGAYLPLDPEYPPERLAFMVADGQAPVLLTQASLADRLPATAAAVIVLDQDWGSESDAALPDETAPDDLAYVIYTSGSTGRPKGTAIPHRAIMRLVCNTNYIQLSAADRIAQASNASFDAATFEIWGALLHGGTLVGISKDVALTPVLLADALRRERITAIFLTTALFNQVAREVPAAFRTVGTVLFGGEACDVGAVRAVLTAGGPARLLHVYGPTESTTFATYYPVQGVPEDAITVPIGYPLANTTCYVLDGRFQPVPAGIPGEFCLGGDGLARGYLNQPELTAERFVATDYGRLYRTGDLVRWLPDGAIEFLGRSDDQVKLRGFRIELGEIETALLAHPAVKGAVVLVREDGTAGRRLVAYVTPAEGLTASELRAYLKERLPEYMIPAAFVAMAAFPLNPNGKVDRRALPAPDLTGAEREYVAPRNPTEEALAAIFAEVLEMARVSIHDHFFELGGHSLLATRAASRIREALSAELPLRTFFERPTVAELAAALAPGEAGGPAVPPVAPVPRDGALPLSFAQQRLWFLAEWEPESPFYNIPAAYRLQGPLDVEALRRSLGALAARHEALRTTFAAVDGRPVQVIAPPTPVALAITDLSHLPGAEAEAEARRLADAEGRRPFDLGCGPLLRTGLIRLAEQDHLLLLTLHHIAADGTSLKILTDELAQLYGEYAAGGQPTLPPLPVQYADYAAWQQAWLSGAELERQAGYWRQQLAGAPALIDLPTDRPRPAAMSYRGRTAYFTVPAELFAGLERLSRQENTTLYMTLLAAWGALLHRCARQSEVLLGTPVAGRSRRELEGVVGLFANTLVLRINLEGDPSFRELLGRVRETALGAYAHQDLPFEKLLEELQPERNMSYPPLFQVLFSLQEDLMGDLALPGLSGRLLPPDTGTAKFDLSMGLSRTDHGLTGALEYATDLFDAETAERLIGHYLTLLESVVRDPSLSVSKAELLPADERRLLLEEWNRTEAPYPRYRCVHDLFEEQAAAVSDRTALVCGDESMTYGELNRRANQLAHYLTRLGVGPDVPVGLCLERSAAMVVALLATWKAGGAYLPLDPAYPPERLAYMLADAKAPVLVTRGGAPVGFDGRTVDLELDAAAIAGEADAGLDGGARPEHLAYIIYTSGSTGQPKGVAVEHRSAVNFLTSMRTSPGLTPSDTLLAVTSISFDIHVLELHLTLTTGARLILATRDEAADGRRLAELIARHGVTALQGTPATWRLLLEAGWQAPPAMKLLVGGEALPPELAAKLLAFGGEVWNMYGPTETTVWSAIWRVEPGPVLIGRPIANTRIYLLDERLNPLPVGVPGELYIGGDGLARGYLGRPDLTAERFIDSPWGRLYRTGDLARYRPDGRLECLGRTDDQVKLRGFRIELGEIEAVLERHPAVAQAAAAVREDAPGSRYLAAYCVVRGQAPSPAELRAYLKEQLPEYMLPAVFVALERLPLTPNGKVDRKALPAPAAVGARAGRAYTAPRTPAEEVLAAIWSQVLDVSPVGIDDNYFELGGDSIKSIRIRFLAEERGLRLALQDLFRCPTVRELAAVVQTAAAAGSAAEAIAPFALLTDEDRRLLPAGLADAYPATSLQAAMLVQSLTRPETYRNVSSYTVRLALDEGALAAAARALTRRHAVLRTAFDIGTYSEPMQLVYPAAELPLMVADLRGLAPAECDAALKAWEAGELARDWQWNQAPLARLAVHRLTDAELRISLSFHHAILDGWSATGLMTELLERCQTATELPAAPPPAAFRDYVALERQALASEASRSFWQAQLAGAPVGLNFGAPAPKPGARQVHSYLEVSLEQQVSDGLLAVARRHALPVKSLLLAAHLKALSLAAGRDDVLTGLVTNGRPETAGGDELLGLFLNTVPLRLRLPESATWVELARQALAAETALLPHRRFPLAEMAGPAPEVYFNYANFREDRSGTALVDVGGAAWSGFPLGADFYMDPLAGRLRIFIEYDALRFGRGQIAALGRCCERVLTAMAADPDSPVSQAGLVTAADRQALAQAPRVCADMTEETARQLLERVDELTDDEVELLLALTRDDEKEERS